MSAEDREIKASSSYEISSPTASQRGGGLPQITVKLYFCNDVPGEADTAIAQAMLDYNALLAFRPDQGPA